MKKYIVIFVALFVTSQSKSQKKLGPILPYGNHSVAEVKSFAMKNTDSSAHYRQALLAWFNECLKDTLAKPLTDKDIPWIFNQTQVEWVSLPPNGYQNSGSYNGELTFFTCGKEYKGDAGVFHWGGYTINVYKYNCANQLRVPVKRELAIKEPQVKEIKKEEIVYRPAPFVRRQEVPDTVTEFVKKTVKITYIEEERIITTPVNYAVASNNCCQQQGPRFIISLAANVGFHQGGNSYQPNNPIIVDNNHASGTPGWGGYTNNNASGTTGWTGGGYNYTNNNASGTYGSMYSNTNYNASGTSGNNTGYNNASSGNGWTH